MKSGFGDRLNVVLAECGLPALNGSDSARFEAYFELLKRWNQRMNLTAVRDEDAILRRHFAESIACAHAIPAGVSTLLDFGSGAGFPGIPIAICRPEIAVTLAESKTKKAAFLREAVRVVGLPASVHGGRAEDLAKNFECVALRAVDRMQEAVVASGQLVRPGGWMLLLTTGVELAALQAAAGAEFSWSRPAPLPYGENRIVAFGKRVSLPA